MVINPSIAFVLSHWLLVDITAAKLNGKTTVRGLNVKKCLKH